jgi:hypothetical protein
MATDAGMGFSTPEDVERLIWPTRDKAPLSVSITPIFVIEVEGWPAGQEKTADWACAAGDLRAHRRGLIPLRTMDSLFAKRMKSFSQFLAALEAFAVPDDRRLRRQLHRRRRRDRRQL